MKTLSQNTTSSACAPETDLQQLVATLVPDEQRISFWPQHFGLIPQWVTLEPRVFGWMDRLCEDYCGGNVQALNMGRIVVDVDGVNLAELINKVAENGDSLRVVDERDSTETPATYASPHQLL